MNTLKKIVIFSFVSLFACASNKEKVKSEIIRIPIDPNEIKFCDDWGTIIEDIDFIPLETQKDAVIGGIGKIQFQNKTFLIKTSDHKVFAFSNIGKLVYHFSNIGKGKNELPFVLDCCFGQDKQLYIFGSDNYLVIDTAYNIVAEKNLPVSECTSIGNSPVSWLVESSNVFFQWYNSNSVSPGNEKFCLYITDSSGKILSKHFPYDHFTGEGSFPQSTGNTLVAPPNLNDTIYYFNQGAINPMFYIDFGGKKYISGTYKTETSDDLRTPHHLSSFFVRNGLCGEILEPVMNDEYLIFKFSSSKYRINCIYNKISKNVLLTTCYYNQIDNLFTPLHIFASYDNYFVASIDAWKVRQLMDENKTTCTFLNEKRRLELLEKLKNVKETDNPVLMIIKTKK